MAQVAMGLSDAVTWTLDKAKKLGLSSFDIFAGTSRSLGLSVFQGKVQNTEISESVGMGVRVLHKGAPGYAYTERLTTTALEQTLRDALSHCDFTEPIDVQLPGPMPLPQAWPTYEPTLQSLTLERMTEFCLATEKIAFSLDQEIENVPYLGMGLSESTACFANSEGVFHMQQHNSYSAGLGVVALRNGVRKMGVYNRGGRDLSRATPEGLASNAVQRAVELLGAQPMQGGAMPVVFDNRVSGTLVSMFLSPFYAENVQKGQSRLEGKLGETIAPTFFQMVCDPFRPDLPGSEILDGEGVIPKRLDVIRDGVLQTYLYNLETSRKDSVASTGSASRGYSGKVGTSFSNCLVAPGDLDQKGLLNLFPRCLYIVKLEGSSGCSAVSGEISIGAQGFLVENGEFLHPVEGITLSANWFELLPRLVAMGKDYNDNWSSIKVPALAFEKMAVSA